MDSVLTHQLSSTGSRCLSELLTSHSQSYGAHVLGANVRHLNFRTVPEWKSVLCWSSCHCSSTALGGTGSILNIDASKKQRKKKEKMVLAFVFWLDCCFISYFCGSWTRILPGTVNMCSLGLLYTTKNSSINFCDHILQNKVSILSCFHVRVWMGRAPIFSTMQKMHMELYLLYNTIYYLLYNVFNILFEFDWLTDWLQHLW